MTYEKIKTDLYRTRASRASIADSSKNINSGSLSTKRIDDCAASISSYKSKESPYWRNNYTSWRSNYTSWVMEHNTSETPYKYSENNNFVSNRVPFNYAKFNKENTSVYSKKIKSYFDLIPISEVLAASNISNISNDVLYIMALNSLAPSINNPLSRVVSNIRSYVKKEKGRERGMLQYKITIDTKIVRNTMVFLTGHYQANSHPMFTDVCNNNSFDLSKLTDKDQKLVADFNTISKE